MKFSHVQRQPHFYMSYLDSSRALSRVSVRLVLIRSQAFSVRCFLLRPGPVTSIIQSVQIALALPSIFVVHVTSKTAANRGSQHTCLAQLCASADPTSCLLPSFRLRCSLLTKIHSWRDRGEGCCPPYRTQKTAAHKSTCDVLSARAMLRGGAQPIQLVTSTGRSVSLGPIAERAPTGHVRSRGIGLRSACSCTSTKYYLLDGSLYIECTPSNPCVRTFNAWENEA